MLGNSKYVIIISFPQQNWIREGVTIQVLITILVIFDVSGAIEAACWSSVLMTHKYFNCPTNIYKLTKSYLCRRTVVMRTNNVQLEKLVSNVCFGKGLWNIQYKSFLTWNSGNKPKNSLSRRIINNCKDKKYMRSMKY